jgi:hypothetical protein
VGERIYSSGSEHSDPCVQAEAQQSILGMLALRNFCWAASSRITCASAARERWWSATRDTESESE